MRRIAATVSAALLCISLNAQQRDGFEEIRQDPWKAGNVFYMYDHDVPAPAAAPNGYKPFYISHYGRHGARSHSSEKDFDNILGILRTAGERGQLTETGKKCLADYEKVYPIIHGRSSDLTGHGVTQQHKIAHNMYRRYRRAFRGDAKIEANSTQVPRVILTMNAFCEQMHFENPKLRIEQQASEATINVTNPFTKSHPDVEATDEGYNNKYAYWQEGFQQYRRDNINPEAFFSTLVTDTGIVKEFGDPFEVEFGFFETFSNLQCNDKVTVNMLQYIPIDELCRLWDTVNYRFYCSKGPDTLYQKGRQWAFCWTTMQDILDLADKDIESGEYAARLRFGHDIIVMSLFALLDVDGYNKAVGDFSELKNTWFSYDFPMSLNVQFVFYRNAKDDVLVRAMYNERDIEFPIENCGTRYYYRWDDFKSFARQRIELAHHIIATTQAPPKKK